MVLCVLCLHTFIRPLEENLPVLQIGRSKPFTPVLAYADGMYVFVSQSTDFAKIHQAICCFEQATMVLLNTSKSKGRAVGAWTEPRTMLGIELHDRV